jgi:23S rRNA pseudouridine1911/1915/1917 synthase
MLTVMCRPELLIATAERQIVNQQRLSAGAAHCRMIVLMTDSQWTVGPAEARARLDKFLASSDRLGSRGRATSALERGKVFLNGAETAPSDGAVRLTEGDVVRVWMDRPGSARRPSAASSIRGAKNLTIVHEDDVLVVVDKPAGLLAVPLERREEAPSVYELLTEHLRARKRRPFVVHRIDRDTSGLVVFTKDPRTQRLLREQFKRREPERIYLAVVYGHPAPPQGTWCDRLVWDPRALIMKETHPRDPSGKDAVSHYRVVESFETTSLIEVGLHTGKRNQIRLQARLRGHTLVGEQRYTFGPDELRPVAFARQALHAQRLAFRHPADDRPVHFESPLPADLEALLAQLRRG